MVGLHLALTVVPRRQDDLELATDIEHSLREHRVGAAGYATHAHQVGPAVGREDAVASSDLAQTELGWKPEKPEIIDIVRDAWRFHRQLNNSIRIR